MKSSVSITAGLILALLGAGFLALSLSKQAESPLNRDTNRASDDQPGPDTPHGRTVGPHKGSRSLVLSSFRIDNQSPQRIAAMKILRFSDSGSHELLSADKTGLCEARPGVIVILGSRMATRILRLREGDAERVVQVRGLAKVRVEGLTHQERVSLKPARSGTSKAQQDSALRDARTLGRIAERATKYRTEEIVRAVERITKQLERGFDPIQLSFAACTKDAAYRWSRVPIGLPLQLTVRAAKGVAFLDDRYGELSWNGTSWVAEFTARLESETLRIRYYPLKDNRWWVKGSIGLPSGFKPAGKFQVRITNIEIPKQLAGRTVSFPVEVRAEFNGVDFRLEGHKEGQKSIVVRGLSLQGDELIMSRAFEAIRGRTADLGLLTPVSSTVIRVEGDFPDHSKIEVGVVSHAKRSFEIRHGMISLGLIVNPSVEKTVWGLSTGCRYIFSVDAQDVGGLRVKTFQKPVVLHGADTVILKLDTTRSCSARILVSDPQQKHKFASWFVLDAASRKKVRFKGRPVWKAGQWVHNIRIKKGRYVLLAIPRGPNDSAFAAVSFVVMGENTTATGRFKEGLSVSGRLPRGYLATAKWISAFCGSVQIKSMRVEGSAEFELRGLPIGLALKLVALTADGKVVGHAPVNQDPPDSTRIEIVENHWKK